jgi:hypothetical protein
MNDKKVADQHLKEIHQPLKPEDIDPSQQPAQKSEIHRSDVTLTANPGDRINEAKTLEEKAQQVAVNAPDITGDRVVVPTYFVFNMPDGTQQAFHHVKDAKKISDLIRLARMDENGNQIWC